MKFMEDRLDIFLSELLTGKCQKEGDSFAINSCPQIATQSGICLYNLKKIKSFTKSKLDLSQNFNNLAFSTDQHILVLF